MGPLPPLLLLLRRVVSGAVLVFLLAATLFFCEGVGLGIVGLFVFPFLFCFVLWISAFVFFPHYRHTKADTPAPHPALPIPPEARVGHPLVSRWALHSASSPQPNSAFPGLGKEHGALPSPGHPGMQQEGLPEQLEAGPTGDRIRGTRGIRGTPLRITGRSPFYGTFSLSPNQGVIFAPLSLLCSAATGNFGRARVENPKAINCKRPLSTSPLHSLSIIILFFIF